MANSYSFFLRALFFSLFFSGLVNAKSLRVAVASNFSHSLKKLSATFFQQTGIQIQISQGSSGKLFSQIRNGAPYDIFLSADSLRPRKLEELGIGVKNGRFAFAEGILALWSSKKQKGHDLLFRLKTGNFKNLAIANPKLAPFGKAAEGYLKKNKMWVLFKPKIVFGENIGQAFYFTQSGNADLGLVALSQLKQLGIAPSQYQIISEGQLLPITQEGFILKNSEEAIRFVSFLLSSDTRKRIEGMGYGVP